uniref:Uncharacterized protein n=1 Tax=Arundo donax TaxID=35708 RepID=A0A0A9F7Z8_ARUDO
MIPFCSTGPITDILKRCFACG